jgi:hypothetical protein
MNRPVEYAQAVTLHAEELRGALAILDAWCAAPDW